MVPLREPRKPAITEAYLVGEGHSFAQHSVVLNISSKSALLKLLGPEEQLPEVIHVSVPQLKIWRRARVVWQRDVFRGIEFLAEG